MPCSNSIRVVCAIYAQHMSRSGQYVKIYVHMMVHDHAFIPSGFGRTGQSNDQCGTVMHLSSYLP